MLGLTWQHTRGSALLGWVGNDAAFLADPDRGCEPVKDPAADRPFRGAEVNTSVKGAARATAYRS